jgi:hypothetical protein
MTGNVNCLGAALSYLAVNKRSSEVSPPPAVSKIGLDTVAGAPTWLAECDWI